MPDQRIAKYTEALKFAERQVAATIQRYPDYFPVYTTGGKWFHSGEAWTDWTGGFLAGMMWQFHLRTGDGAWRERAEHYSRLLEHRQHDRNVHDLGFIFLSTYLPWYKLTGEEHLHKDSITFMELKRIWDDPALYNKTEWLGNPAAVEWVMERGYGQTPGVVHIPGRGPPVIKLRTPLK